VCGICGIVDFGAPPSRETVARMAETLVHRGPDDAGLEAHGDAVLGFRRLSVIDLEGSHQPLSDASGERWLVFNGEIYNFQELRAELLGRGHRFKTRGDGEVILHLYEERGDDFVHALNGMFAVALWDGRRRRLVLARDRLGIKPLYYATPGSSLAFASELKALLEVETVAPRLDLEAAVGFACYGSMPGARTGLDGVHQLPPAHLAVFDRSGLRLVRWWDEAEVEKDERAPAEIDAQVDALLRDVVRLQRVADVPLGAFLSGGVDSSLVAALLARESDRPVEAFSIGFGRPGDFMNEIEYARKVATRHGMRHHELSLEPDDFVRDVDRMAWLLDEPCGDPAALLTLKLSELARRHVTVTLSGLGADEILGGYRRYTALAWQERLRRVPRPLRDALRAALRRLPESRTSRALDRVRLARKLVDSVGDDLESTWARTISYLPEDAGPVFTGDMAWATRASYRAEVFRESWARTEGMVDPADRALYMDRRMYLPDQLLHLQDKMSMGASLEARVPFLDHRLVELCASIPARDLFRGGQRKAILKRVAEAYVPRECIYRTKQGFFAPVEDWLRGGLREPLEEALSPRRVRERGVFEVDYVETLKRRFFAGGADLSMQLYFVFMLETWARQVLDGEGRRFGGEVSPALPSRPAPAPPAAR